MALYFHDTSGYLGSHPRTVPSHPRAGSEGPGTAVPDQALAVSSPAVQDLW